MLTPVYSIAALIGIAIATPAMAEMKPEVRQAVRLEACRIQAEKTVPDRLIDQAIAVRKRAAVIADCVTHTGSTTREANASER
jgi:hypothetical protein